ncbi:MAG: damage-inducible protein DinB [Comamonadaceae bacterium]|nr:MAG: damage-inducible protein DinB [Comamonadaceae bacterium]
MTPQNAALMAEYNRWMNDRMYEAAGKLDGAELSADKGAFFGSILGTLNHIVVADLIWLRRFAQQPASSQTLNALSAFPRPASLREILAADLTSLRALRQRLDELIVQWAGELTPELLSSHLSYTSTAGVASRRNFGALVQHFFNHQTHHRGQASTLLFQSGVDMGVTDLVAIIPSSDA